MVWALVEGLDEDLDLPWATPALPESHKEGGRLDDDVKRRTFLLGIPAAWLLSRPGLRQPLWSRTEASALDVTTLDELAATVASDARLHDRLGSRAVHGLVTEHVRLVTGLLGGDPPQALRPRLAAIASEAGDGALHTTVGDLLLWAENLVTGDVGGEGWRSAMLTRGRLADGTAISYAGGLFVEEQHGELLIWHSGEWAGYRAALHLLPDTGLAVAVACNLASIDPANRALQVLEVWHSR